MLHRTEFEPDRYYATVFEDLTRLNGERSYYAQLSDRHAIYLVKPKIKTKADLLEAVEGIIDRIVTYKDFTVTENKYGWVFERYIKWNADDTKYVVTEPGAHSDHERYTVEIARYIEEEDPLARLDFMAKIDADIEAYREASK